MLVIAAAAALLSSAEARPRRDGRAVQSSAFDGSWSLLIETASGPCDRGYRLGLDVVGGIVMHDGTPYGRVTSRGDVRVRVESGALSGVGGGRLSRSSGRGMWRGVGPSGACSGNWIAQRRD